jgi:hypothetical protein
MQQIMSIKTKIKENNLIITKAGKSKTLYILTHEDYKLKIDNFIQDNYFTKSDKKPTQQFKRAIKQILKQCKTSYKR